MNLTFDYSHRAGACFDVRDGKSARLTYYYDLQDWIRPIGGDAI